MRRVFWIIPILVSCVGKPGDRTPILDKDKEQNIGANWPPSKSFPSLPFSKAKLFRLDSAHYQKTDISMEHNILNAGYTNGLSFIYSSGKPSSKFYTEHRLTSVEQNELKSVLQTNDSSNISTNCIPFYRDVLVFYDAENRQTAQAQICFQCHQVYFTPRIYGLFDYRNWKKLQDLVSKIADH